MPDAPSDGQFYVRQNGQWVLFPTAKANQISVANPVGTGNSAWTMMGLGLTASPIMTRAVAVCDGQVSNSGNNGETDLQLMYGVGTPPNNGDPVPTGAVVLGEQIRYINKSGGGFVPFSQSGLMTGLVPGQTIWIGLAMKTIGGNGSVQDISLLAFELL